jgi:TfoX/Sxy family transcriptional regulator of competence genes
LKPTEAGRALLGKVVERPPYPGAKNHFLADEVLDDPELLQRLCKATASALPAMKKKRAAAKKRRAPRKVAKRAK